MTTSSLRQKISLVLFGVFLTMVILELVLRLGGWLFTLRQDNLNAGLSFRNNEFRILCLGESTTALGGEISYPFQLEQILRKMQPDINFQIINKGMVSKTSADILEQLDKNLEQYQPQLVIAMLGINDRPLLVAQNSLGAKIYNVLRRVRIFHLGELLAEHLQQKFTGHNPAEPKQETTALGDELMNGQEQNLNRMVRTIVGIEETIALLQHNARENPATQEQINQQVRQLHWQQAWVLVGMGQFQRLRSHYPESETALLSALKLFPDELGFLLELGRCYKDQGFCEKAVPYFQKVIARTSKPVLAMMELGRCYESLGQDDKVYALAKIILNQKNDEPWVYGEVGSWLLKHNHLNEAERFFLKATEVVPDDAEPYEQLAKIYDRLGDLAKAQESRKKAAAVQKKIDDYLPETQQNYQKIAEKILGRGIKLVVMQYPLRRIGPLREILKDFPGIIFVENKTNFEDALKFRKYPDLFKDNFAVNFGHCTRRGNQLIAQQLGEIISRNILQ